MLVLSLFFSLPTLLADSFFRLDRNGFESVAIPHKGIVTFISQECASCKAQVKDFQACAHGIPVLLFMDGQNEEKLRQELRQKPLGFPTYWTTEKLKIKYRIGKVTPTSLLLNKRSIKRIEGRLPCDRLVGVLKTEFGHFK
jgi:hypothetical protein